MAIPTQIQLDRQTTTTLGWISRYECRTVEQMVAYIVQEYIKTYERERYQRIQLDQLKEIQHKAAVSNAGAVAPGSGRQ